MKSAEIQNGGSVAFSRMSSLLCILGNWPIGLKTFHVGSNWVCQLVHQKLWGQDQCEMRYLFIFSWPNGRTWSHGSQNLIPSFPIKAQLLSGSVRTDLPSWSFRLTGSNTFSLLSSLALYWLTRPVHISQSVSLLWKQLRSTLSGICPRQFGLGEKCVTSA